MLLKAFTTSVLVGLSNPNLIKATAFFSGITIAPRRLSCFKPCFDNAFS